MFFALILIISFLVRIPLWANPEGLNSDHAVSALQALHILRGELSWFLWGVSYQASLEPFINAGFFLVIGKNSYAVLATSYLAYAVSLWAIYAILRRQLPANKAAFAALFVVIATPPLFIGTFYAPRPWCLTTIFVGLYLGDRGQFGWAAFLAFFALYVDFFAIQFLPALLAYSAVKAWVSPERRKALQRFGVGLVFGILVLGLTRLLAPSGSTHLGVKFSHLVSNLKLMFEAMLPMIYGLPTRLASQEIPLPAWFRNPGWFVARALAALIPLVVIARELRQWRNWDRESRDLTGFGLLLCATSFTATMLSGDVYDVYAYRYLTPLTWALPFLLLPTIKKMELKNSVRLFAPYFLIALMTGQLYYGTPVNDEKEQALGSLLELENIRYGYSTYWPSYRITYLLRENVIVVPINEQSDRYKPYRVAVEQAPRYALIFTDAEKDLFIAEGQRLVSERRPHKLFDVAGYRGFIVER